MSIPSTRRPSEPTPVSQFPPGRDAVELVRTQLEAIDAWNAEARSASAAVVSASLSREMRLDVSRRMDARRREQVALLARAAAQLEASGQLLSGRARVRAVLAHRNAWLRDAVSARLTALGVVVTGAFEDGADAAGTVVVEQPDLLLVEDRLPTLSGLELVQRARLYCPGTLIGVQVADGSSIASLTEAGARAVFTRRIPPQDIAEQLVACLVGGAEATVALR